MSSYTDEREQRIQTYARKFQDLDHGSLIKKDLMNQRQATRNWTASGSAAAAAFGTGHISGPVHYPVALYHVNKAGQSELKSEASNRVLSEKGLTRQTPTWYNEVEDQARGVGMGSSGGKVVWKAWNKVCKWF